MPVLKREETAEIPGVVEVSIGASPREGIWVGVKGVWDGQHPGWAQVRVKVRVREGEAR